MTVLNVTFSFLKNEQNTVNFCIFSIEVHILLFDPRADRPSSSLI